MTASPRRTRIAAVVWVVVAGVVWNGTYDLLLTRSVKEFLLRGAQYEAGRGPAVPVGLFMEYAIYDAVWKSTLAASLILLVALVTIRYLGRTP
jgi:hypothetical protein